MLDDDTIVLPSLPRRPAARRDASSASRSRPRTLRSDRRSLVVRHRPAARREPRFGLDERSAETPPVPTTANDLAWSHMSPDGNPETPAPFAIADPPAAAGGDARLDGLHWGASAAVQAHLTYQHPVRVAIRAPTCSRRPAAHP